jgi:hypothetical protein
MIRQINYSSDIMGSCFSGGVLKNSFIFLTLIIITYYLKIPMAYQNFYAEDGMLFYQQAKDLSFPTDLLTPSTGYLMLISRIIARIVVLFPLELSPVINFVLTCYFIAIFCAVTYKNLANFITNNFIKIFVCFSIILLPILNFEVLAASCGLHFILLFPAVLIFINFRSKLPISNLDVIILLLAILSDPTSFFCALVLLQPINSKTWRSFELKIKYIYASILICLSLQFFTVINSLYNGDRAIQRNSSFLKTIYLYFDRVIGNSIIPNWGFVSSADFATGMFNATLILRGGVSVIIVVLVSIFILKLWNLKNNCVMNRQLKINLPLLLASSIAYWFFCGYFFNPEPRYAIFPGLCFITAVLMLIDISIQKGINIAIRFHSWYISLIAILFILIWGFSFTPSAQRTSGPTWVSELNSARFECINNKNTEIIKLQILPTLAGDWFVKIKCSEIS